MFHLIMEKLYILAFINIICFGVLKMEENPKKYREKHKTIDDFGFMLWRLESFKEFFPCYKSMIKGEKK